MEWVASLSRESEMGLVSPISPKGVWKRQSVRAMGSEYALALRVIASIL